MHMFVLHARVTHRACKTLSTNYLRIFCDYLVGLNISSELHRKNVYYFYRAWNLCRCKFGIHTLYNRQTQKLTWNKMRTTHTANMQFDCCRMVHLAFHNHKSGESSLQQGLQSSPAAHEHHPSLESFDRVLVSHRSTSRRFFWVQIDKLWQSACWGNGEGAVYCYMVWTAKSHYIVDNW